MTNAELEKRITALEAEVALLKKEKAVKRNDYNLPWWKQIIGTFADDPAHEEAMRLGREYRESQKMVYDEEDGK